MSATPPTFFRRYWADMMLMIMSVIWGFHYIVVKDAVNVMPPLAFNAVRFLIGLPAILVFGLRYRGWLHVRARDVALLALLTATGPLLYQVGFLLGIARTTSTNSALLTATMPTWTALFSIVFGLVLLQRRLVIGIGITLAGVTLVVLSRAEDGLALSRADLVGSLLLIGAAAANGLSNVVNKPVVDRLDAMPSAIWKYIFTTLGLTLLALPDLVRLSPETMPARYVPNLLYSGLLSAVGGFLAVNIGLKILGPTRSASYFNYNPVIAGFAGVVVLGEPFSGWLVVGGALTLWGVLTVRGNTYLRKKPAAEPAAHAP